MAYYYQGSNAQHKTQALSYAGGTNCASFGPTPVGVAQSASSNRLGSSIGTVALTLPTAPPSRTVSFIATAGCGPVSGGGGGLGAAYGYGGQQGTNIITTSKGGLCATGSNSGNCGTATTPGRAALINDYVGNPNVSFCTLNTDEFCKFRISSGTYSSLSSNTFNTAVSFNSGLSVPQTSQLSCGLTQNNLTAFATHWMQIGSIFKLSGIAGVYIGTTNSTGISGTTGNIGNVPFPQLLLNLPIVTTITSCATLSGMANAFILEYPLGQQFSTNVVPNLISIFPIFYSINLGCTTSTTAGILLTIGAPLGLNGGSTAAFPAGTMSNTNKSYAMIIQFEITIDLGSNG